jgi:hypothetical protein
MAPDTEEDKPPLPTIEGAGCRADARPAGDERAQQCAPGAESTRRRLEEGGAPLQAALSELPYGTTMVNSTDGGLTPAPFSATIRT